MLDVLCDYCCLVFCYLVDGCLLLWGFVCDGIWFDVGMCFVLVCDDIDVLVVMVVVGGGIVWLVVFVVVLWLLCGELQVLFVIGDGVCILFELMWLFLCVSDCCDFMFKVWVLMQVLFDVLFEVWWVDMVQGVGVVGRILVVKSMVEQY